MLQELRDRGLLYQCTDESILSMPMTVYAGFDPTADGLHVGHLLPLVTLRRLQQAGHRVIALVGGATGLVGDPSGKATERALRSQQEISDNLDGIRGELGRLLCMDGTNPALIVDNADWTKRLSLLDFLRDIGKHFSINEMIRKDSVQTRLTEREQGISFTEFSYSLLQANDFLELFRSEGCTLQIGGSDQWGNITAGIELIRKKCQQTAYGLTLPLLTNADGKKFGKTEKGAVWLSAKKTSPYQFYQFWVRSDEREVIRLLKFFTFLSLEEIAELEQANRDQPARREAQRRLASEMTRMVHGETGLELAERASKVLFGGSLDGIDEQTFLAAMEGVPKVTLKVLPDGSMQRMT
jgi:tyrosyl-tRNA synthetase